jgi:hypothetical protein
MCNVVTFVFLCLRVTAEKFGDPRWLPYCQLIIVCADADASAPAP